MQDPQLIFVRYLDGDIEVRCPHCSHISPLMQDFSLLKAGFNGIKSGDADDVDLQECGVCTGRSGWDNLPVDDGED